MSENGILKEIHPVLPVKDVSKAIDFYVNKLGFKLGFKDTGKDPTYAGVRRDGIEIHLQWHNTEEWQAGIDRPLLRIYTKNVTALYNEYKTQDVFHKLTSLQQTPWGTKEFGFYDLDSNGLVFYRDV